MGTYWWIEHLADGHPVVMYFDPATAISRITGDGRRWIDSRLPIDEYAGDGTATPATEAEARAVFGRLPDDIPAAS